MHSCKGFTVWLKPEITREMDIDAIEEAIFCIVGVEKIKRITTGDSQPNPQIKQLHETLNEG